LFGHHLLGLPAARQSEKSPQAHGLHARVLPDIERYADEAVRLDLSQQRVK